MAMMAIALSSLPNLHDIIATKEGPRAWVPDFGIQQLLADADQKILGYSSYRVFLYIFLTNIFTLIGWIWWHNVSKKKAYGNAILMPILLTSYNLVIILGNLRATWFNGVQAKLVLIAALLPILFFMARIKRNKWPLFSVRTFVVWSVFALLATSFFFHDIITDRAGGLHSWIPKLGIGALLEGQNGAINDFGSYRIFLFFLMLHLSPHLAWAGVFFDSRSKLYRPFILVPVISTAYPVVLIFLGARETKYNEPDIKFYIAMGVAVLVALNFFYNNVYLSKSPQKSKPPRSFGHKPHV